MTKETKELRRTYWALLTAFALLIAMGMANVFSATFVSDGVQGRFFNHLMRQAIFFIVGLGPALFLYKKDYRIWRNYTKWIIIGAVVLLLIVFPIGIVVNGAAAGSASPDLPSAIGGGEAGRYFVCSVPFSRFLGTAQAH